jgi:hypothetical protein
MATVTKNFKVKSGLVVEGTTGTINNYDILTKKQDDQDYLVDLIEGAATSASTALKVVIRDANGDFAAREISADLIGDVLGQVSDISNHDTDDLTEGSTNQYFTAQRVKNVLTGSTQTNISITEVGGDLHITAENGVDDSTTDDLAEGTTNKYFTEQRVRDVLTGGDGISFNDTTGDISADVSGGLHIDAAQIKIDRTTVDTWYDANGAASDVAGDLSTHEGLTSGVHGVTGSVVGTTDTQDLSNKRFIDTTYFTDGVTVNDEGQIAILSPNHEFEIKANYGDLDLKTVASGADVKIISDSGDIILDADGNSYIGGSSAGNEIATHSYVDNAISGLDWKNAVNLLATSDVNMTGSTGTLVIDGHAALDTSDVGYRILLIDQDVDSENGIYTYTESTGTYTLVRTDDTDTFGELVGAAVFVMEGTQYGQTSWVQSNHYITDFTGQNWTQFSGSGSVTAGTGITVDGLEVSVDRTTVDTWYEPAGAISTHADLTSTHGVSGNIVGTSDTQSLSNKTITDSLHFQDGINNYSAIYANADDLKIDGSDDIVLTTNNGDIILNADGTSYLGSAASGNEIATQQYVDDQDTDDVAEGTTNQYFTAQRVRDVLTGSTQTNISITEVSGELIITAENGVEDSTTDDLDEGTNNQYFTDARAKDSAAGLLTNATLTNITITGSGSGLTITAENGVADSDTDDLTEGTTNLYFTDQRAVDALEAVVPNFTEIDVNSVARQVAATVEVATASTITAFDWAKASFRSAEFLVKVAYSTHTEISKVMLTLDTSDNIAITEYAIVGTNGSSSSISADVSGTDVRLRVTTLNNNSDVTVVGTLLV